MFFIIQSDGNPGSHAYYELFGPFATKEEAESSLLPDSEDAFYSVVALSDISEMKPSPSDDEEEAEEVSYLSREQEMAILADAFMADRTITAEDVERNSAGLGDEVKGYLLDAIAKNPRTAEDVEDAKLAWKELDEYCRTHDDTGKRSVEDMFAAVTKMAEFDQRIRGVKPE